MRIALVLAVVALSTQLAHAQGYTFDVLKRTGELEAGNTISGFGQGARIDDAGRLVYRVDFVDGAKALFVDSTQLVTRGDFVDGVEIRAVSDVAVSRSGKIAFRAVTPTGHAIFTPTSLVVRDGDALHGVTLTALSSAAVNDAGEIAFVAETPTGQAVLTTQRIVAQSGGTVGGATIDSFFGSCRINDRGQVAYHAFLTDGTGLCIDNALIARNGTTIDGSTLVLMGFFPDVNRLGVSSFFAVAQANERGIFTQTKALVRTGDVIAGTTINDFIGGSTINDSGESAFMALIDAGRGIFTQYASVLRTGDALDDKTVADVTTYPFINSRGKIGIWVKFTDGSEAIVRANPPDRDGDGLRDLWEERGFVIATPEGGETPVDLPEMGADPDVRDMFVEVDYLAGHMPSTQAIDLVKNAFAAYGIVLHVRIDEEIPITDALAVLGSGSSNYLWKQTPHPQGAVDHFEELKDTRYDPALASAVRYCIYANDLPGGASGVARGNGAHDFVVALGSFGGGVTEEAGTFMHELGHTLGLTHGGLSGSGQADLAWKPNYSSVMNYWFQRYGVGRDNGSTALPNDPLDRTAVEIDFSPFALPELDERALDESAGLGPNAAGYQVRWMCGGTEKSQATGNAAIDWNCKDGDSQLSVIANVSRGAGPQAIDNNFQPAFGSAAGTPGLLGHNDWAALDFSGGGTIGAGVGDLPPPLPDVTPLIELDVATAAAIKPPAPAGLVARGGRRAVRLRWRVSGPLGDFTYNVYRSVGGNAATLLGSTLAGGFIDRGASRGVVYTYSIAVVDRLAGESLRSPGVQASAR